MFDFAKIFFSCKFELFDSENKLLIFKTSITCFYFSYFKIFCLSSFFEDFDKDVIKKWVEGKVISLGIPIVLQCEYRLSSPVT